MSVINTLETLNSSINKRSAALGGAQKFAYRYDMSHFLRSIRLASHLVYRVIQCFPLILMNNVRELLKVLGKCFGNTVGIIDANRRA